MEVKNEDFVKWLGRIKSDPRKRNKKKYYEFHQDHGHNTKDYFQLKEQIDNLIKKWYLRKYLQEIGADLECPTISKPLELRLP